MKKKGNRIMCRQGDQRKKSDESIRTTWTALRNLSDLSIEAMTDADFIVWGAVTKHPAVQDRLNERGIIKEKR